MVFLRVKSNQGRISGKGVHLYKGVCGGRGGGHAYVSSQDYRSKTCLAHVAHA